MMDMYCVSCIINWYDAKLNGERPRPATTVFEGSMYCSKHLYRLIKREVVMTTPNYANPLCRGCGGKRDMIIHTEGGAPGYHPYA